MLPFNGNKTAEAYTVTIPTCPCHSGTVTALTSGAGGGKSSGNYRLNGDVNITSGITISGTVNLCLNGYKLEYTGTTAAPVITLSRNAKLNLYDCGNDESHKHYYNKDANGVYKFTNNVTDTYLTGGVIAGGSKLGINGLISLATANVSSTVFNMYGGNIAGNTNSGWGGGLYFQRSTFNMYAGKFCGNYSANGGGGICTESGGSVFNMYGGEITDNKSGRSTAGGIYVEMGSVATFYGSSKVYGNLDDEGNNADVTCNAKINVGDINADATIGIYSIYDDVKGSEGKYEDGSFIDNNNSGKTITELLLSPFFADAHRTHTFTELVPEVAATCTVKGMQAHYKCTGCDNYFNTSYELVSKSSLEIAVDPNAHSWGEWSDSKAATCTAAGEKVRICAYNSAHKDTQSISAKGHDYEEEFTVDTPATCTTAGSQSRHCKNCDDKIEVTVIPMLDHDWGEWVTVTAPTCTEGGTSQRVCTRDKTHTETKTVTATGHKYTDTVIPPTCTEDGYTKHTCFCGDSYDDTPTDATGHTYGEPAWVWGTNYLTATAKFSCSVCHGERTLNASVTHESTTASCTVAGDVTHTATVN